MYAAEASPRASASENTMMSEATVRGAAVRSLSALVRHGKYSNLEVNSALSGSRFGDADRRLYTTLVYGVVERIPTLDYIISVLSSRPVDTIDVGTMTCLRLGLYQLIYMDRIPPHAAINETVAEAPRQSKGFVNALLREFLRRGKEYPMPEGDALRYISVKYSCPEAMCSYLIGKLGEDTAVRVMSSWLERRHVTLRVNTLVTTADELIRDVFPEGTVSPLSDDVISVPSLAGSDMTDGRYFVQDASSTLAVKALAPMPGETVIDTCAAPGGKTFSAAIDMKNEGAVFSFDLHENKVGLIRKGADRLGLDIVTASCRDATDPSHEFIGKADRVICDAPCSGLGVVGKKPDIKYKDVSETEKLPEVQSRVLRGASRYVRPGGILVYSTCTLSPDENGAVVRGFLEENADFEPCPFKAGAVESDGDGMLTLYPFVHGTDGFFISKMKRRGGEI